MAINEIIETAKELIEKKGMKIMDAIIEAEKI